MDEIGPVGSRAVSGNFNTGGAANTPAGSDPVPHQIKKLLEQLKPPINAQIISKAIEQYNNATPAEKAAIGKFLMHNPSPSEIHAILKHMGLS